MSQTKVKYDGKRWLYSASVKIVSKERVKGTVCFRLYDKDKFEIANMAFKGDLNLASNASDSISSEKWMDYKEKIQVTNVKVYAGKFGCADSPSESISNVVEIKVN